MTWIVVLAVGAGSFLLRVMPLLLLERRPLGPVGERTVRHAGIAAITGLIAVSTTHSAERGNALPALLALAAAMSITVRGHSMVRTVLTGSAVYATALVAIDLITR